MTNFVNIDGLSVKNNTFSTHEPDCMIAAQVIPPWQKIIKIHRILERQIINFLRNGDRRNLCHRKFVKCFHILVDQEYKPCPKSIGENAETVAM